MKKRSRVRKSSVRKTARRTTKRNTYSGFLLPFSFRRIIFITTCIVLFIFVFTLLNGYGRQQVAGLSITSGLFAQSTVQLPQIEGAIYYNLYYKEKDEKIYKNAVRSIPPTETEYTISYLSRGKDYVYQVAAVNGVGAEFWFSPEQPLTNLQSM